MGEVCEQLCEGCGHKPAEWKATYRAGVFRNICTGCKEWEEKSWPLLYALAPQFISRIGGRVHGRLEVIMYADGSWRVLHNGEPLLLDEVDVKVHMPKGGGIWGFHRPSPLSAHANRPVGGPEDAEGNPITKTYKPVVGPECVVVEVPNVAQNTYVTTGAYVNSDAAKVVDWFSEEAKKHEVGEGFSHKAVVKVTRETIPIPPESQGVIEQWLATCQYVQKADGTCGCPGDVLMQRGCQCGGK